MTDREIAAALLHEQGEYEVGQRLGYGWNRMLLDLALSPAELMARAVRDHLADCLVTLPALVQEGDVAHLHFYLGNLTNMRKQIFPALQVAYDVWAQGGDTGPLADLARRGVDHWEGLAREMMRVHARIDGPRAAEPIRELVAASHL